MMTRAACSMSMSSETKVSAMAPVSVDSTLALTPLPRPSASTHRVRPLTRSRRLNTASPQTGCPCLGTWCVPSSRKGGSRRGGKGLVLQRSFMGGRKTVGY